MEQASEVFERTDAVIQVKQVNKSYGSIVNPGGVGGPIWYWQWSPCCKVGIYSAQTALFAGAAAQRHCPNSLYIGANSKQNK